jgi:UDP-glucose 4-epimerase
VVGDGTQSRDFLYATDVAEAFLAAETDKAGRIYNIGAGKPQTVNRLVELLGGNAVYIPKRPGEPDCTWADITRISTELGWKPKVSFEEGVRRVLNDIDYWRDAPLWTPESIAEATKTWFTYLGVDPTVVSPAAKSTTRSRGGTKLAIHYDHH